MREVCGPQTVTPMLLESENDDANDDDEELPSHVTLIDSDSDESADEAGSDSSSDDEVDRHKEVLLSTILAQLAKRGTACPRANIQAEYGQELYLSDLSDNESPPERKVLAIRKRTSKGKTLRFAIWSTIIEYDTTEDSVCDTAKDRAHNF